jgi:hypothetical protein
MRIRPILFTLLAAIGLFWALPVWANIPTMTVSEIQPGMKGVGRTVIKGTEIREFDVEIIGVFENMGYNHGPLIFMKISGPVVDESGGCAGGYSGSPVFIDGRLIGAISWGPYFTHGDVIGATPIDEMLKVLNYEKSPDDQQASAVPTCLEKPIETAGRQFDSIMLADSTAEAADLQNTWGDNTLILTPCRTPLIVSGLSEDGFNRLKAFAADKLPYLDLVQGPGGGSQEGVPLLLGPTVLRPGASIGVQLASGDLDLTAIGTLTWVDDSGRFLVFGHPFLDAGNINAPLVTSRIIYTMPALDRSYKLGEPIETVGTATEDRLTAVGGHLRQIPDMVQFHLTVLDKDANRTARYNYSVIRNEDFLPMLGMLVPIEGISFASGRSGPGTCKVGFSLRGEGLANPITRENLIYASYSAADEALSEFTEALMMVTSMNTYRKVRLTDVDLKIEVSSDRETMDIVKARFQDAPNIGPGAIGYTGPPKPAPGAEQPQAPAAPGEPSPAPAEGGASSEIQAPPPQVPIDELMMMGGAELGGYGATPPATQLVSYHPGDKIKIVVTLRPYRLETVEQILELEVPADFPAGPTMIEVYGGSTAYFGSMYTPGMGPQGGMYVPPGAIVSPESLEEIIKNFEDRPVSNSITVRLMQAAPQDPYSYLQDDYKPPEEIKSTVATEDVVFGYYTLPIQILAPGQKPGEPPQQNGGQPPTGSPGAQQGEEPGQASRNHNPYR